MAPMTRSVFSPGLRSVSSITVFFFLQACASSTLIQSQPSGAKLYLNGEPVGNTPYTMTDTKIIGSTTTVRLEHPGYESTNGVIARNEEFEVGACIGGMFLLFPFLWVQKYKPTHTFELRPAGAAAGAGAPVPAYPSAPAPAPGQPGHPPAPPASAPVPSSRPPSQASPPAPPSASSAPPRG
jgi:PEGA domain